MNNRDRWEFLCQILPQNPSSHMMILQKAVILWVFLKSHCYKKFRVICWSDKFKEKIIMPWRFLLGICFIWSCFCSLRYNVKQGSTSFFIREAWDSLLVSDNIFQNIFLFILRPVRSLQTSFTDIVSQDELHILWNLSRRKTETTFDKINYVLSAHIYLILQL